MNLIKDYISSIKNPKVEEPMDMIFFRPLAFILVKPLSYLPLTPNQISFLSCVAGVWAAYFFSLGSYASFRYAACFYALYAVLDCCDGMIARLKGTGSPLGRVVDGVVDYVVGIAVHVGLAIGLLRSGLDVKYNVWGLCIFAGFSTIAHCIFFDFYLNKYLDFVSGKKDSVRKDIEKYSSAENSEQKLWHKISIAIYVLYSKIQNLFQFQEVSLNSQIYCKENVKAMRLWGLIGPSAHIAFLVLAAGLFKPMIFFFYVLVFGNIWFLFVIFFQSQINKKVMRASPAYSSIL
ncbi:MAG: CDP-alcohol phosphatidyltransferase family protein [Deltaproteobacteria bacterium]|nr:CDP-alcohol phosphatidyltransferase family protein [Deltaproteobacteria bacterium]